VGSTLPQVITKDLVRAVETGLLVLAKSHSLILGISLDGRIWGLWMILRRVICSRPAGSLWIYCFNLSLFYPNVLDFMEFDLRWYS
jgi:hypothetical protein